MSRGVTLLEVAVAVGIIAFIGTVTGGTIGTSLDAYETVSTVDAKYHNVRVALNRMARDISMAFLTAPIPGVEEDAQWKTLFQGKSSGRLHELRFTSLGHEVMRENAKESEQCEIGYYADRDPDYSSQTNLMRAVDPRLDSRPEEGGRGHILAEDVKELRFRYWDERKDDWTSEWDTEDEAYARRLPLFVEIRIVVEDPWGEEATFMTKTRIFNPKELQ